MVQFGDGGSANIQPLNVPYQEFPNIFEISMKGFDFRRENRLKLDAPLHLLQHRPA